MQVSRYGDGCRGQFPVLYVETAGERYTGLRCNVDASVETDCLRHVLFVSGRAVVHVLDTVAYDVVETDIPRYREVIVCACHVLPSQPGVHKAVWVGERIEVLRRYRVDVVYCGLRFVLIGSVRQTEKV